MNRELKPARHLGVVKAWNRTVGFGFVADVAAMDFDIFVGLQDVPMRARQRALVIGETLTFEIQIRGNRACAVNLQFPDPEPEPLPQHPHAE